MDVAARAVGLDPLDDRIVREVSLVAEGVALVVPREEEERRQRVGVGFSL